MDDMRSLRRAMESHRVRFLDFTKQYRYTYNLLSSSALRDEDPVDVMRRMIRFTAEDNEILSWLREHCPDHGRCGLWIGFNDENEAFAYRMTWT